MRIDRCRSARLSLPAALVSGAAVWAACGLATGPAAAQALVMSRADYEACQAQDEAGFRRAIDALTLKGLQAGLASVDYRAVVADEWRRMNFDDIIDKQVDVAIAEVRQETSWGRLIQSLGSADEAQRLATAVAERTFKSEPTRVALDGLAGSMGRALAKRIELALVDTADPAQQCMHAFLGPRYGSTIARVVARDAGKQYAIDPAKAGASVSTTSVLAEGAEGLTGAVILLARRQLSNMASRVGARMVGSVLSRVVSAAAGGVGVVLIAKDIWEFRNGVLPIVATEMKSRETKDKVQLELAAAIKEQIGENLKEISAKTADRVIEVWQEFRRAHAKVLSLADTEPRFKQFMDRVKPETLGRLDEVVGLIVAQEGDAGVMQRLQNGTLDHAVHKLPSAALEIAREARSLETGLAWAAIAGDDIGRVHEMELHRRAKPDSFTKASLARLLGLGDKTAIIRLASQTPAIRETLFELDGRELRTLARALGEAELASLAGYLTGLDKASGQRLLRAVSETPARMQVLGRSSVRDGIVSSRDPAAAVGMMLASDAVPDPWQVASHARLALDGKVAPILLWERHPVFVLSFGAAVLMLLVMLKRLLFARRARVVVQRIEVAPVPPPPDAPPIRSARR